MSRKKRKCVEMTGFGGTEGRTAPRFPGRREAEREQGGVRRQKRAEKAPPAYLLNNTLPAKTAGGAGTGFG